MVAFTQTPADTAGALDATTRGFGRAPADTAGALDSPGVGRAPAALADTGGALDTALINRGPNPADPGGAVDTLLVPVQANQRVLADPVAASDNAVPVLVRTDIDNHQFVINREPWVPFGAGQAINVQTFDMGTRSPRTQDQDSEVADIRLMGQDFFTPPVWSWQCNTDVTSEHEALGWTEDLAEVWDAPDIRSQPNAAVELLYRVDNRDRVVYGRPRNFTPQYGNSRQGSRLITMDFALAEALTYEADWQSVSAYVISPASASAFPPFPWAFPLPTSVTTNGASQLAVVTGRVPTWLLAVFTGPIDNPVLTIGQQRWGLLGSIDAGRYVSICGMPWDFGVIRDDGAYLPGMLDPRARLSQLKLAPGQYPVTLTGDNATSTARVDVYWRPAYRQH